MKYSIPNNIENEGRLMTDESSAGQSFKANGGIAYFWFWTWLLLVTAGSIWIYVQIAGTIWTLVPGIAELASVERKGSVHAWLEPIALGLAGLLYWWRIVKVVVLQGSPFAFGMQVVPGRQEDGRRGRPATYSFIGDMDVYSSPYKGNFWFGAVFRAHPGSDKLMRSRLELLVLSLPCSLTLSVHESRVFVSRGNHKDRATRFRRVSDNYASKVEKMSSDRFRKELAAAVGRIAQVMVNAQSPNRMDSGTPSHHPSA